MIYLTETITITLNTHFTEADSEEEAIRKENLGQTLKLIGSKTYKLHRATEVPGEIEPAE